LGWLGAGIRGRLGGQEKLMAGGGWTGTGGVLLCGWQAGMEWMDGCIRGLRREKLVKWFGSIAMGLAWDVS